MFFAQTSTLPPSMHHKLAEHAKVLCANQPTRNEKLYLEKTLISIVSSFFVSVASGMVLVFLEKWTVSF